MRSTSADVGFLMSSSGSYRLVSRAMLNGALLAAEEVAAADNGVTLAVVIRDPGGELSAYRAYAAEMLQSGIKHVVGCYTSSSRKELIPLFEKHDALLWYPSHYEGFETAENVVYTGATTNQHILPLIDYLVRHHGKRAYCVGSNYIWPWENNRVLREEIVARGGAVLGERYFAIGDRDFGQLVASIIAARPDFVFVTLIGTSAYAFYREFRETCRLHGIDQASAMPIASCSLAEPELEAIGPDAVDGHISSSVYFSSIDTNENRRFVAAYVTRFPEGPTPSADAEAAYICTWLLAKTLAAAEGNDLAAIKAAAARQRLRAPQGDVRLDAETCHAWLTPRIGRSNVHARFDIVAEAREPMQPDPYLVRSAPRFESLAPALLRAVP